MVGKHEEGSSERDIMRHSEPARAIIPPHTHFPLLEQLIQPPADNKPTPRLHTQTHTRAHIASQKTKPMMSQAHMYTAAPLYKWCLGCQSHLMSFATSLFLCKR